MPPTVYHLRNEAGIEVFTGTIVPAPGGGSQPGALYKTDVLFNEPEVPHADLVATVPVAENETVREIELIPLAGPWADSGAGITVGDSDDSAGYYDDDGSWNGAVYDPTNANAGTNYDFLQYGGSTYQKTGLMTAGGSSGGVGKLYPVADTLTMTVGTIATGGGGGQLLVRVWKAAASTPIVAA